MVIVNAMGDACPIPVVKTKRAIGQLPEGGEVCTLVDNEIAVQNLTKMAKQKGYDSSAQKLGEGQYQVHMVVPGPGREPENPVSSEKREETGAGTEKEFQEPETECIPQRRQRGTVAVISSDRMGNGSDELGLSLMKAFLYALASQDALPDRVIFYNGGAPLTCQGSACLTDIRNLEAQGVEIITCGTCLNYFGLTDQLAVGSVSNMYEIVEALMSAQKVIRP